MLTKLGIHARRHVANNPPWTNVYGLARTVLALGTLVTLALNHSSVLFRPAAGVQTAPFCTGGSAFSVWCMLSRDQLELVRFICIGVLIVVATGWRPRITAPFHWWVAYSLQASAITLDGGDQVSAILALLLLPVALTDSRKWHWQSYDAALTPREECKRIIASAAWLAIRVQVAGIYLHSFVGKFVVEEWKNGTALYYWWTDPIFGAAPWTEPFVEATLKSALMVVTLTWGALLLELLLFLGLVLQPAQRRWLLPAGIAFHLAIALVQGLVSFGFAMTAALILFLRPSAQTFSLGRHYMEGWSWTHIAARRLATRS